MVKRIVAALILIVVLLASYWAYGRYTSNARLRDGEVTVSDVRDPDGNIVHATPSHSDTPGTINTVPVAANSNATAQSAAALPQMQTQPTASQSTAAPATDSQAPNAPNGVAFAGSGRFQVYRQGNLTWRINTDNGTSCILFATNEEWRKPLVFNHGCPTS